MHLFLLPREVTKKIQSIMGYFIWAGTLLSGKFHLVKGSLIAIPIEEGGWSIIDPSAFNIVLIIKNMWRAASGTGIWPHIIKDKYMYGQSFTTWIFGGAKKKTISSYIWKSMMKNIH